jgi:subtilisin family serine protease
MKLPGSLALCAFLLSACATAGSPPVSPTPASPSPSSPSPVTAPATAPRSSLREPPADWHLLDLASDGLAGISARRADREVLAGRQPQRTVIVAVIDGGVDTSHADIRANLWVNAAETPGNRADDDRNGYVDDTRGWNFIGGADGRNIDNETLEVTRLFRRCTNAPGAPPLAPADRDRCPAIQRDYERELGEMRQTAAILETLNERLQIAIPLLRSAIGTDSLTLARVEALQPARADVREARSLYLQIAGFGLSPEDVPEQAKTVTGLLEYGLNPAFDARSIVGDNPLDLTHRVYGNADATGPDALHGTHVAGIIGAVRGNGIGVDGIAPAVKIMSVRTVPNGDERDKDVANAIRYAVDNGALVLNLSFGKSYSPEKQAVDDAVRYAESRGALIVHASGNDGENSDQNPSFPTPAYVGGGRATNWIEVGASSWRGGDSLAAPFSNYGRTLVDVFAPGVDILSTDGKGGVARESGTSMAAPVVSGLAALIMAYHPNLTAAQVKRIILESAVPFRNQMVVQPGGDGTVPFGTLSGTGAIVNAYNALRMAQSMNPIPQ